MSPNGRTVIDHPWKTKGPALFLVLLLNRKLSLRSFTLLVTNRVRLTVGPNWTIASLPPLKSILQKELLIDNAQYGDVRQSRIVSNVEC